MTEHTLENGATLMMLDDGTALISSKHDVVELSAADVAAIRGPGFDVAKLLEWLGNQSYRSLTSMESAAYLDVAGHVRGMVGAPGPSPTGEYVDLRTLGTSNGWENAARLAMSPRPEPVPRVSELPEGARWDGGVVVLSDGRRVMCGPPAMPGHFRVTSPAGFSQLCWVDLALAGAAVIAQTNPSDSSLGGVESGGVFLDEFRTTHMDEPLSPAVLRHNAYATGWEHGAMDYRPPAPYWDKLRGLDLGLLDLYTRGRWDGEAARGRGWATAREHRGDQPGGDEAGAQLERLRAMPSGHVGPSRAVAVLRSMAEGGCEGDGDVCPETDAPIGEWCHPCRAERAIGGAEEEPDLSHCTACDKSTRHGTIIGCQDCGALRLLDGQPEWMVELEKLAPGRGHIGPWVLERISKLESDLRCMTHDRDQWSKGTFSREGLAKLGAAEERIAELEAMDALIRESSVLPVAEDKTLPLETWEDDAALVRIVVKNSILAGASAFADPLTVWSRVARQFGIGAASAMKLARRLGLDPHKLVGVIHDDEEDVVQ